MPDKTIGQWCLSRNISKPTFYELKKKGMAPETYAVPGIRGEKITEKSDLAWEARMKALAKTKEAKQAAARRKAAAQHAAAAAIQSPLHVSKRGVAPPATPAVKRPKLAAVPPAGAAR